MLETEDNIIDEDAPDSTHEVEPEAKPDPTAALIEHTRKIIEQTTQSSDRAIRLAQQALEQRSVPVERTPAPIAEPDEDWSDIDLTDTASGLKKFSSRIEKRVESKVEKALQSLVSRFDEVYTRDRNDDFGYRSTIERDRARTKLGKKFEELEDDIEAIIDPIRKADPKAAARSGIYTDAYYVALGKQRHEELVAEDRRAPTLGGTSRSSGSLEQPTRIAATDRDRLKNTIGVDVDDEEFAVLSGSGSIVDYQSFMAKKRSAGGKR